MIRHIAALCLILPAAATAQTYAVPSRNVSGTSHTVLVSDHRSLSYRAPHSERADYQCLERKSAGHVECHTPSQWARIAAKISAAR